MRNQPSCSRLHKMGRWPYDGARHPVSGKLIAVWSGTTSLHRAAVREKEDGRHAEQTPTNIASISGYRCSRRVVFGEKVPVPLSASVCSSMSAPLRASQRIEPQPKTADVVLVRGERSRAARILIIDDHEANIEALTRILRSAGFVSVNSTTD